MSFLVFRDLVIIKEWSRLSRMLWIRCLRKNDPSKSTRSLTTQVAPYANTSKTMKLFLLLLFSRSVMSSSLWLHELQHARLPCPSPSSGVCSNWCPLSQWWHLTISFSVTLFLLLPSIFPINKIFSNESALCIGNSPSSNIHTLSDWLFWFPYCPRDSQESFPASQFKSINSSVLCCFMVQHSHPYWKTIALTIWTFVGKVKSLLFNTLSRIANWGLPWWLSGKKSAC